MPSHDDYVYLAGIIDGEGHITVHRSAWIWYSIRVVVTSTSLDLMEYLKTTFGGNYSVASRTGQYGNNRRSWHWRPSIKGLVTTLTEIEPYVIIKKQQVRLAQEYLEKCKDGRKEKQTEQIAQYKSDAFLEFKRLNRTGADTLLPKLVDVT